MEIQVWHLGGRESRHQGEWFAFDIRSYGALTVYDLAARGNMAAQYRLLLREILCHP